MLRNFIVSVCSFLFFSINPAFAADTPFLIQFRNDFVQLAKDAEKCAVSITATINPGEQSKAGPYIQMRNSAAGLVFDENHIIVKQKVVNGSDDIEVRFYDGQSQKGKVIGTDWDYGLALVKVDAKIDSLMHPHIKSAPMEVAPGEPVLVLSNSLDVMPAVTFGIINCTRQDGMIQVSTDMPAGTGGGAVFDFFGRLVGLIAAEIDLFADEIPYSTDIVSSKTVLIYPTAEINRVAEALVAHAAKNPVYLGILAADWPSQLGGAHIKQVFANSPASEADFRLGDIVLSIDNHKVASAYDLFQEISIHNPGDEVKFEILRGEQIKDKIVKITSPPSTTSRQPQTIVTSSSNSNPRSQNISKEFLRMRLDRLEKDLQKTREMLENE